MARKATAQTAQRWKARAERAKLDEQIASEMGKMVASKTESQRLAHRAKIEELKAKKRTYKVRKRSVRKK